MSSKPCLFFGAGTARGGTGIVMQTLNAHPKVNFGLDLYLGLFRAFRDAVALSAVPDAIARGFVPGQSLSDYVFSALQRDVLDALMETDLDLAFPSTAAEQTALIDTWKPRAIHEGKDLIPHMDTLRGKTFKEVIEKAARLVNDVRGNEEAVYTGSLENWIVEFFPALARSYQEARFIIVLRDPRAIQASHLAGAADIQTTMLSFARSLRKLHTLARYYLSIPLFEGRLCVVAYEELVRFPERTARAFCSFLDLDWDPGMIDPENHLQPWSNAPRDGVSSFEANATGYNPARIDRWKEKISESALEFTEFAMDPDMRHFGYMPVLDRSGQITLSDETLRAFATDLNKPTKWRIDTGLLELELGIELARRRLLTESSGIDDPAVTRRCFVDRDLYDGLVRPPAIDAPGEAKGGIWFA